MQIKHHIIRKFHESRQAPLWKWIVVIFMIIAFPMFFMLVNTGQTQQAIDVDEQESAAANPAT